MPAVRGFTLIEVLVALTIMAVMAALGWQSIDTMVRTQSLTRAQGDATQRLVAGLEQWSRDLDEMQLDATLSESLQFDGLVLRLVRRNHANAGGGAGLRVVAWAVRPGGEHTEWVRWQSPVVSDSGSLRQAWERAALWARGGNMASDQGDSATAVAPTQRWQVFFHRGGSWVNPQSAAADTGSASPAMAPDAVRLVLDGLHAPGLTGRLQRDWVQPGLTPSR